MSIDPLDYGMTRYTELEISDHAVAIQGLPKNIPRRDLENRLMTILSGLFSGEVPEPVLKVRVLSDYDHCFKLVQQLKLTAGIYKKCVDINNKSGKRLQKTIKNGFSSQRVDAVEYYQ